MSNSAEPPGSLLGRILKTPAGMVCIAGVIALAVADAVWLLNGDVGSHAPPPKPDPAAAAADRLLQEQIARAARYIKPTVTASMSDLGGKYFGQPPDPARTRHYYIAAENVQWDFMPAGKDEVCGMPVPLAVETAHQAWRVRYVQYTDGTFTKPIPQPARLGILGPVLRGVVGDYLEVTFLNRAKGGPFSMHPHGVKYDKDSEGSYHSDAADQANQSRVAGAAATSHFEGLGAAVGYGGRFTYVWYCDEQSGPLPSEPSSKGWLYHSHVSSGSEINRGLEGFIIVTDPKRARPDGTPSDVDREMAALFLIYDASGNGSEASEAAGLPMSGTQWAMSQSFREQSERYTINGYIYGNLHGLDMNEGERVRWYLFGLGSEKDLHTAHWHGLRVLEEGQRQTDTIELLPGSMKVADMVADNPGDWLFHCHVEEHMAGGMFARVTVYPRDHAAASREPSKAFFGLTPVER